MPTRAAIAHVSSRIRLIAAILAVVFGAQLTVALGIFMLLPHVPLVVLAIVDAAALALLVTPALSPLTRQSPPTDDIAPRARAGDVLERAGDAIITIDEKGVIQSANTAAEAIFGHPAAGLVGVDVTTLLLQSPDKELQNATDRGAVRPGERPGADRRQDLIGRQDVIGRRADGVTFPAELTVSEVPTGGRRFLTAIVRDMTERRRVEDALRDSEERYRLLFDSNPTPLFLFDPETLRFLAVNTAALRQYGYTREEFLAMTIHQLRPPEDVPLLMQHLASPTVDGTRRGTFRHVRKDGSIIQVEINSQAMEFGGANARLVIATDVSERAALEQQLRQSQKMEAVGQLAGGMAHDFNNLLSTILTTAELMAAEVPGSSVLKDDLDTIRVAAGHGSTLTAKLLAFGRRKPLEYRAFKVDELLGDFGRLMRRLVPENIELTLALGAGDARVLADSGAIEQIVMNLVTNARDAMPGGGVLRVVTERLAVDEEFCSGHAGTTPGEYVLLSVSDTGVGMNADTLARIFEPFFTTKPVGVGTGLGMAMVYGLVKQHRGYVEVSSQPGAGTVVRVYLPLVGEIAATPLPEPAPVSGGSGETILLVEDEPALRRAATRVLTRSGYTVLVARDGREALDLLERDGSPKLIITDVVMPRLGGNELIKALRQRGRRIRVLFTSGYPSRGEVPEDLEPGLPFLTKPWTIPELLAAVRSALDAPLPDGITGPAT